MYINSRDILVKNGFDVNGIITAGGGLDGTPESYKTQDFARCTEIARIYYLYGDLTSSHDKTIEQFYNERKFLDLGYEDVKGYIDSYLEGDKGKFSNWMNFASHGTKDTPIDVIEQILDYCISKGISIVTWKDIYDKFRSSKLATNVSTTTNLVVDGFQYPFEIIKKQGIIYVSSKDNITTKNFVNGWITDKFVLPYTPLCRISEKIFNDKGDLGIINCVLNGSMNLFFKEDTPSGTNISLYFSYPTNN